MNKNVMIVLAGGFVVAILVAVLVQASLGGKKTASAPVAEILVASQDLAVGTDLSDENLKWQSWADEPFVGAIVRKKDEKPSEALTGKIVTKVSAGQPVLQSYVFKEGKGNIVAASLGKGMRAIAIPVKDNTMAGGFVAPGDYVDVILSYDVQTDSRANPDVATLVNKAASETILQNLKVLAVDQESSREDDTAKVARTVTLEVTAAGAEKLALATTMGDLTLTLRGIGDTDDPNEKLGTTDVQVGKVMQDVARIQGGSAGPSGKIRIYNGTQLEEVKPRNSGDDNNGNATQDNGQTVRLQ